jgi:hypothetical protein
MAATPLSKSNDNPHFPALRSDPMALSAASRKKQIPAAISDHFKPSGDHLRIRRSAQMDLRGIPKQVTGVMRPHRWDQTGASHRNPARSAPFHHRFRLQDPLPPWSAVPPHEYALNFHPYSRTRRRPCHHFVDYVPSGLPHSGESSFIRLWRVFSQRAARILLPRMVSLIVLSWRSRLRVSLRSRARFSAALPLRTRHWSSSKVTSRTQWQRFSIPQWPRTISPSLSASGA